MQRREHTFPQQKCKRGTFTLSLRRVGGAVTVVETDGAAVGRKAGTHREAAALAEECVGCQDLFFALFELVFIQVHNLEHFLFLGDGSWELLRILFSQVEPVQFSVAFLVEVFLLVNFVLQ